MDCSGDWMPAASTLGDCWTLCFKRSSMEEWSKASSLGDESLSSPDVGGPDMVPLPIDEPPLDLKRFENPVSARPSFFEPSNLEACFMSSWSEKPPFAGGLAVSFLGCSFSVRSMILLGLVGAVAAAFGSGTSCLSSFGSDMVYKYLC